MQRVQNTLLKATIPIFKVVNQLMTNPNGTDNDKALIKHLMDSVALLGILIVNLSRDLIRPDLNNNYQQLCSEHIEFASWLFGDDLPKQVQDIIISATNRGSQQLSSRHDCRQSPGSSYSRHGNPARGHSYSHQNFYQGPRRQKPPYKSKRKNFPKNYQEGYQKNYQLRL